MSWDSLELLIALLVGLNLVGAGVFIGARVARRRQPGVASSSRDEEIMRVLEAVTSRLENLEQRADFSERLIAGTPPTGVRQQSIAPDDQVVVTGSANRSALHVDPPAD